MTDHPIRVLLVEDDDVDREAFERHIQKNKIPYAYHIATSESEAIEALQSHVFDIVLLDYHLGTATGLDLLPHIGDTPVVFVTGSGSEAIAVEAMRRGARDYLIKSPDQNYLAVLPSTIKNVLERRQSEKALQESEARYRAIVEDQTELICRFTPEYRLTFANAAFARYWGKNPADIIGVRAAVFLTESSRETDLPQPASFLPTDPILTIEHAVRNPAGERCWQIWTYRAFFIENGDITEFQAVGRDITIRKQTEEALAASEKKLDSIIKAVPDIIYRLDEEGRITYVSDAVIRYGYQPAELVGRPVLEMVYPSDRDKAAFKINERRTGNRRTMSYEIRLLTRDKSTVHFEVFSVSAEGLYAPDEISSKTFIGTQGIARDITDRKAAEEERERLIHDLKHALNNVKTLSGLLPICSHCKKIRDDAGYWKQIESYIESHSEASFSHSLCPVCLDDLYGNEEWYRKNKK